MIWVYSRKNSEHLTKLIHPRILPVTWLTLTCLRQNYCQWVYLLGQRWVIRENCQPACSTSLRASRGREHRKGRNPVFQLPHYTPSLSRPGLLLPGHSHNLTDPNFLLLPNQLCLLGQSPPTRRERGVQRVKSQWRGGNPNPLKRKTKPRELKNS